MGALNENVDRKSGDSRDSLLVVIIYLLTATLWILFSDRFLTLILPSLDAHTLTAGQTVKGLVFVLITGAMLYLLVLHSIKRVRKLDVRIHESENIYHTLFDSVRDALFLIHDEVIADCNEAACRMFAMSKSELIGKTIWDLSPEQQGDGLPSREKARQHIHACKSGSALFFEWVHVRKNGDPFIVEIGLSCFDIQDRGYLLSSVRDITERKKNEHDLQQAKERSEKSDQLKDLFLANVSHEIRTPLNLIMGYAGLIEAKFLENGGKKNAPCFSGLSHGCRRLMKTVEQLVSISTLQAGMVEVLPTTIMPMHVITSLISTFQEEARDKGLELTFIDEYPDGSLSVDVLCFEKTLTNLLDNAVKFTNAGSITIRQQANDTHYSVHITDTGIGIAEEYQKNIFSLFSQEVQGYTRPFDGLGLGLALTKRYADMIGATITFSSIKDQGSTFSINVPLHTPAVHEVPPYLHTQPSVPPTGSSNGVLHHLLLVEDDPLSQELIRALLARDYQLSFASSAAEAWTYLEIHTIDAILMDLSIQGNVDGLQLTQRIRASEMYKDIPVIVITAHALPEDREKCEAAQCNHYFAKPFNASELRRVLAQLLNNHSSSSTRL